MVNKMKLQFREAGSGYKRLIGQVRILSVKEKICRFSADVTTDHGEID